jgi:hypothetical protein
MQGVAHGYDYEATLFIWKSRWSWIWEKWIKEADIISIADPHNIDADSDADPDPNFQIKAQNLEKVLK